HGKGGDEDRAVDADPVHGRHHLVAGGVVRPVRDTVPRPFRGVRVIAVDLGIDDRHREVPPCWGAYFGPNIDCLGGMSRSPRGPRWRWRSSRILDGQVRE